MLGDQHPDTLRSINNLGLLYLNTGRNLEAESLLRTALSSYEKAFPDSWERYSCQSMLGASLTGQKKYQDAEPLVIDGYEKMVQRKATIPAGISSPLEQAGQRIVRLYRNWGKADQAAEWTRTTSDHSKAARSPIGGPRGAP